MFVKLIAVVLVTAVLGLRFDASLVSAQLGAEEDTTPPPADPLAPFNEKMFWFNLKLDDYLVRPVASGYAKIFPIGARRGVDRFFDNVGVVPRFANNLLQFRLVGAARELSRFLVNTTLGGVGFFDVADSWLGLKPSPADFGQTLWKYGVPSGPYLVLPFFGPSTIRDAVGLAADGAMHPLNYMDVLSTVEWLAIRSGAQVMYAINYRSMNLELFEDVDRYAVDLYGAVQDAYFQRRERELRATE
ncbi:MAG: VacJ family lipoprotein [Candidatus Binatia bacterium]|nr:VacJ family lipoprotein [Candidatus Binatia bacterium]